MRLHSLQQASYINLRSLVPVTGLPQPFILISAMHSAFLILFLTLTLCVQRATAFSDSSASLKVPQSHAGGIIPLGGLPGVLEARVPQSCAPDNEQCGAGCCFSCKYSSLHDLFSVIITFF